MSRDLAAAFKRERFSTPIQLTVPDGGVNTLLGLNAPDVTLVYPPSLDTSFTGTVWLMGSGFVRGCWATVDSPGLPSYLMPLTFLNERTVGLPPPRPSR